MLPKFRGLTALTGLRVAFPGGILSHPDRTGGLVKRTIKGTWVAFVLASAALAAAQGYTITDIGVLKGDNESSGFWINNFGDVVGCSDTQILGGYPCTGLVAGQHAFYWSKSGGMKDLGTLSAGTVSGAIGVNDSGTVVGYSNIKGQPATNFVAFQWNPTGGMVNLGKLWGGSSSAAFEVNSAGVVAGTMRSTMVEGQAHSAANQRARSGFSASRWAASRLARRPPLPARLSQLTKVKPGRPRARRSARPAAR